MKITKNRLAEIVREEIEEARARRAGRQPGGERERYASSSEEKHQAAAQEAFPGNTIRDLEVLLDQWGGRFTDDEEKILDQALELLNRGDES